MRTIFIRLASLALFISCASWQAFAQTETSFKNYENRALAEVSKNGLLQPMKLLQSPQKVEVNATGNFQLGLPVMTIPGRGGLNFDLALTYTPGIKVTDEASWVGLGWNLDVGCITRMVQGGMDGNINYSTYYNWETDSREPDDMQRDIYSISCPAGGGKAIQIPQDYSFIFRLEENKPWRITYLPSKHSFIVVTEDGTKYVFGLAAPGLSYNAYGNANNGNLYNGVPWEEPYLQWYLTAILGPDYHDGGGANEYDPLDGGVNQGNWIAIYWEYDTYGGHRDFKKFFYKAWSTEYENHYGSDISLTSVTYPKYIITPVYVAKFETENELWNPISQLLDTHWWGINERSGPGWHWPYNGSLATDADDPDQTRPGELKRRLKNIKLYRMDATGGIPTVPGDQTIVQQVDFTYQAPDPSRPGQPMPMEHGYREKRTMLKAITIKAGDITLPNYTFDYYDIIGNDPDISNDLYGNKNPFKPYFKIGIGDLDNKYYTGAMFEPNQASVGFLGWYNSKDHILGLTDLTYADAKQTDGQMWNLRRVSYPRGGYIEFNYESNNYLLDFSYMNKLDPFDAPQIVWGAGSRLVSQTINSGIEQSPVGRYTYEYGTEYNTDDPEVVMSVGRMYADPIEYWDAFNNYGGRTLVLPPQDSWFFHQTTHQVLYQQVWEHQPDGSLVKSHYGTSCLYENLDPDPLVPENNINNQVVFNNTWHRRGLLTKREYYRYDPDYGEIQDNPVKIEEFGRYEILAGSSLANGPRFATQKLADNVNTTLDGVSSTVASNYSFIGYGTDYVCIPDKTVITENGGTGLERTTQIRYPAFYRNDPTINNLLENNIVNPVLLKWTEYSGLIYGATVSLYNYTANDIHHIFPHPYKIYNLLNPESVPDPSADNDIFNARYYSILQNIDSDTRFRIAQTFDDYDSFGNLCQSTNAGGVTTSTIWGYNSTVPVATIGNARASRYSVGGQTSFVGFETGLACDGTNPNEDYWSLYSNQTASTDAHTGRYSWKVPAGNPVYGPTRDFLPPDLASQKKAYILSCWVKTEAGFGKNNGTLLLHSKVDDNNNNNAYPNVSGSIKAVSFGDTKGEWKYIEVKLDLNTVRALGHIPEDQKLRLRAFPYNTDPNKYFLVDDIRFYPQDALLKSYNYDPLTLRATSLSDENSNSSSLEYDGLGRVTNTYGPREVKLAEIMYPDLDTTTANVFRTPNPQGYSKNVTDAFGKPIWQAVQCDEGYAVTEQYYDGMGRLRYSFKPYLTDVPDRDDNGRRYATENKYYAYPLNRTQAQGILGSVWDVSGDHSKRFSYGSNADGEVEGYDAFSLYKTRVTDENGIYSDSYVDKYGKTIASVIDPEGQILVGRTRPSQNNFSGKPAQPTGLDNQNPLRLTTTFEYDITGNLLKSTDPDGLSSRYYYNALGKVTQKTTPDAGNVMYLYDKKGNLRLIKDAAHDEIGIATSKRPAGGSPILADEGYYSGNEPINISGMGNEVYTNTDYFYMPRPGRLYIHLQTQYPLNNGLKVKIMSNNQTVLLNGATSVYSNSYDVSIYLPKGFFTYEIQSTTTMTTSYSIKCSRWCEFVYNKYDMFDRVIEVGEFEAPSNEDDFTQQNADNITFPTDSCFIGKRFIYDTLSTDPMAANQRNLKGRVSTAFSYRLGVIASTSIYSYDEFGRVEWVIQKGLGTSKKITYEYDLQGNITKKGYVDPANTKFCLYTSYAYDQAGRLCRVGSNQNSKATPVQDALYNYGINNKLAHTTLGTGIENIDYSYNERDWLTGISNPHFDMTLEYNNISDPNGIPQFNGNISSILYRMQGVPYALPANPIASTDRVGYSYFYDNANRLTDARFRYYYYNQWNPTLSYTAHYAYTRNGNIDTAQVFGYANTALMDDLKYNYIEDYTGRTNRLNYITEAAQSTTFPGDVEIQDYNNYMYDDNGNMNQDLMSDVGFIIYDINNQPVSVFKRSDGQCYIYYYDAQGYRIRKSALTTESYILGADNKTETVVRSDNLQATHNVWGLDLVGQLKRDRQNWNRFYYLKDHLGTIKMTLDASGGIKGYDDFYPYGMVMENRSGNIGQSDTRFKFTGKERDIETGLDYFGARNYDSKIGMWLTIDPMVVKYPSYSTYLYVLNNPNMYVDPVGLDTFKVNTDDRSINRIPVKDSKNHVYLILRNGEPINTYSLNVTNNGLVEFPGSGIGFDRYGSEDKGGDHYLEAETAAALFGLTSELNQHNSNFRISLGDMSNELGKAPGGNHQMHGGEKGYSGLCIDYRYLDQNYQSFQGYATDRSFGSKENFMFLGYAGEWGFTKNYTTTSAVWPVGSLWSVTINATTLIGHQDHGHLTYIH